MSVETAEAILEPLRARRRFGVSDWKVVAPETLRAVVLAVPKYPVPETVSAVLEAYGKVLAVLEVAVKYPARALLPRSEDPFTENVRHGEVVPIPTLLFALKKILEVAVTVFVPE